MPTRLSPPGPSYLREHEVRVGRPAAAGRDEPPDHARRRLVAGDPVGRRRRRRVVSFRDVAPSAGPPPEPPLARLGPALSGALSGFILEDGGSAVDPTRPGRPARRPAPAVALAGGDPGGLPLGADAGAAMRPNELAETVLAGFRRSIEGLAAPDPSTRRSPGRPTAPTARRVDSGRREEPVRRLHGGAPPSPGGARRRPRPGRAVDPPPTPTTPPEPATTTDTGRGRRRTTKRSDADREPEPAAHRARPGGGPGGPGGPRRPRRPCGAAARTTVPPGARTACAASGSRSSSSRSSPSSPWPGSGLDLWTDAIWFRSVDFDAVFWTRHRRRRRRCSSACSSSSSLFLGVNLWLAGRLAPPPDPERAGRARRVRRPPRRGVRGRRGRAGPAGRTAGRASPVTGSRRAGGPRTITFEAEDLPDLVPIARWGLIAPRRDHRPRDGRRRHRGQWETVLLWQNQVSFAAGWGSAGRRSRSSGATSATTCSSCRSCGSSSRRSTAC